MRGHLNTSGYSAVDVVEMPGEYALRGGILDVYPPESETPVRVELFGDEVESIRKFDPQTQRSAVAVDEIVLLPLSDTPVREDVLGAIHARLSGRRLEADEETLEQIARAEGVTVFPGWEYYAGATADQRIFDLMPGAAVLRDDPIKIESDFEAWWERVRQSHERSGVGNLVRPDELLDSPETWAARVERIPGADVEQLGMFSESGGEEISLRSQSTSRFHGSVPAMVEEVKASLADGRRILFAAANTGEVERLADIFNEYAVPFRVGSRSARPGQETYIEEAGFFAEDLSTATVAKAYVPEGVALPDARVVIFGTGDLFDESEVAGAQPPKRSRSKVSAFLSDFRDLAINDYVVHVEHGIGQYQGLKEIAQGDGETAEFMILEYAEGARLYVPLTRLDLIQKYRSSEGAKPTLSRLGTQQWAKTKARVKKAMKDMADELLKLYAARKTAQGHAFSPTGQFEREFDDAFEFNETDDQVNAIRDVRQDMESDTPMDRLLCGDVGYGKTEVAMRAAFKAVSDNKQVAVLAPTTVLAFQHFETFKRRFAAFPVKIEMISPFPHRQAAERNRREGEQRTGRHPDRDPSRPLQGHPLPRPRVGRHRRGAALRRASQRTPQATAQGSGRAHHVGDADSAHAAHVAARAARYERDRDAAQGPHGHPDGRRQVGREADQERHRAGTRTRRPGLFRAQPGGEHLRDLRKDPRAGAEGEHPRRTRTNG